MSKDKIFHKDNRVYWIKGSDLPNPEQFPIEMYEGKERFIKELEAALSSKGVEVTNAKVIQFGLQEVKNGAEIEIHFSDPVDSTLSKLVLDQRYENTLYDLPEGFEVKIKTEVKCADGINDSEERGCRNDCNCESSQIAIIVPIGSPEPVKQPVMGDLVQNKEGRNWVEDFEHENGKYINQCGECKNYFMGHKRRVRCRICGAEIASFMVIVNDGKVVTKYINGKEEDQDELWKEVERIILCSGPDGYTIEELKQQFILAPRKQ